MKNYRHTKFLIELVKFLSVFFVALTIITFSQKLLEKTNIAPKLEKKADAAYQYAPTGGTLVTGSEVTVDANNVGSWRGTVGNDSATNGSGNYWTTSRNASNGLDKQIQFTQVELSGANKMIITIEDANITTGDAYTHQICDWVSSTNVDVAAAGNCTTGGWRTLPARKVNITAVADTTYTYEIYDGYFWNTSSAPGTVISTPLSNFIEPTNKTVLIRAYSTVASTTQHRMDLAHLEVAVDPVYEPADFVKTNGGTITGNITDLISPTASDDVKVTIPQSAGGTAIDTYFVFKNIKRLSSFNTILVSPEISVSNVALQIGTYIRRFSDNSWVQIGSNYGTTSDVSYESSFNSTTISGFDINNYVSGSNEIWIRFASNTASPARNLLIDRVYLMIGSVNNNTAQCETSWGTANATTCANTRDLINDNAAAVATANSTTWQTAAVIEYPSGAYAGDNDDDATGSEYAFSTNLSFPATLASNTSVTGVHYAVRYRSNVTTIAVDLQVKAHGGDYGTNGYPVGYGWRSTPGTDTNALTNYNFYDTWRISEIQTDPEDYIDTVDNLMNLKLRTVTSTNTTGGVTNDWDFAMVSLRYVEETNRRTLTSQFSPTGGTLVTGSEVTIDANNVGSWRALLGNDSTTNGSGNYWTTSRNASNGLDKQVQFDGVDLYSGNKLVVTIEDSNITTADAYTHQICDWVSTTGVDNGAAGNCTGGGWRTLTPRKVNLTATSDTTSTYEIYDGYFWDTTTAPGTVISTPLSNFVDTTNKRVLIRAFSTVASTTQHRMDLALIETAIDPIYEAANYNKTAGGTMTGQVRDTRGAAASDNNKVLTPMPAISTAADVYFVFKNVRTYPGANSILISDELIVSNAALSVGVYLRNFSGGGSWSQIGSNISPTADTDYARSFNSTTIGGFDISNYVSSSGEVWVRYLTNTPGTVYNFSLDRLYMMVGSVNDNTAYCETSWGTTNATTCANTRDINDNTAAGTSATTTTWQATSVIEYPSGYHPLDNDDDATSGEYAFSQNLAFPVNVPSGGSITGIHYAVRYRSNVTTITVDLQAYLRNGATGLGGDAVGSGWATTPGTDSNALTNYNYYDTYRIGEIQVNPDDYIATYNGIADLRLRTVTSTNTTGGVTRDWDFAMMSLRWVEKNTVISISVSDGSIAYGNVANGASKSTLPSELNDVQTITNSSNVPVDLNIKGQNTACPWTLSGTSGNDQYKHEFAVDTNGSWWNESWDHRRKITFDNSAQAENLTNFPVLVKLNSSRIDYASVQNDYDDLRFIDPDGTVLNYEVEVWNESGDSYVWVNVPQIDSSSSTDYIYVYYGNVTATGMENVSSTWASSYKGVWHLNQIPSATAPQIKNSVGNTFDGTANGSMVSGDSITGKVDKGLHTDGSNDYINIPNTAALDLSGPLTISFWFTPTTTINSSNNVYKGIMSKSTNNTDSDNDWTVFWESTDAGRLRLGAYGDNVQTTNDTWTAGTWYNITATVDGSNNAFIYLNGSQNNFGGDTSIAGNPINGNGVTDIKLGLAKISVGDQYFDGKLDEVKISNVVRSANWTAAAYKSESDTFNSFGSENTYTSPSWTALTTSYQALTTNLAISSTLKFNLKITTPSPNSCNTQQNVDVTVQAVDGS